MKILLFGGTSEGRELSEYLYSRKFNFSVCVATDYAKSYLSDGIETIEGRKDLESIKSLIGLRKYGLVLDATHPYADTVTKNVRSACDTLKVKYIRVVRKLQQIDSICITFDTFQAVVDYLNSTTGNVLLTTGVKNLKDFTQLNDYQERVFTRVLDNEQSIQECEKYQYRHIIKSHGACSLDTNVSHIEQSGAKYLVTKESGSIGGFPAKVEACRLSKITPLVVTRPVQEVGLTIDETIEYLNRTVKDISIVGVGMGDVQDLSQKVLETIQNSEVLIGAKRMVSMFNHDNVYISYDAQDIAAYIDNSNYKNIVVLMSGDTGFFSGTEKLIPLLESHNVVVHSGISSVSYLASKLGISWNDGKVLSIHGKTCNYISAIDRNRKTFLLTSGNVKEVCKDLVYYGLDVNVTIGENLSQKGEKMSYGKPQDFIDREFSTLSTMYVENPNAKDVTKVGIPDDDFIRGKVPMTKSEVRAISISKCDVESDSTCWDIGAGTGSVSVELAMLCPNGKVYAIEKNLEGVGLIRENCKKFRVSNIEILEGNAGSIIESLPPPDVVFIGGSNGELSKILDVVLEKNPSVRVVLNCITLETLSQTLEYLKLVNVQDYEVTQVAITHVNKVSTYSMLKAENPIFVISF